MIRCERCYTVVTQTSGEQTTTRRNTQYKQHGPGNETQWLQPKRSREESTAEPNE